VPGLVALKKLLDKLQLTELAARQALAD
jgi:hypothetical protein